MGRKPLRIAMVHRDLPCIYDRGGVSYHVHYLANHLVARGHEVTVFTTDPRPDDAIYQVHQIAVSEKQRQSKFFQSQVWPVHVARQDYSEFDLVHAHGDSHFLRSNGTPVLRTFYGSALGEAMHAQRLRRKISQIATYPFELLSGKMAAGSTAISYATAKHFPVVDTVIPCGVDLRHFKPSPTKSPNPSVLFVGMLESRKRGTKLVEVFKNEVRPMIPKAELWLVCPEEIEEKGVVCFGKIPTEELIQLYQTAWVFCLPSSYEGFGVPYVEALASGTAVVATANAGAKEVLHDGKYGIVCEEQDLGQALTDLIRNQGKRKKMIKQGLDHAKSFSWDKIIPQYEAVYESLLTT